MKKKLIALSALSALTVGAALLMPGKRYRVKSKSSAPAPEGELTAETPRTVRELTPEEQSAGENAYVDFAFRLLSRALQDPATQNEPNRMLSPLSALMCLGMIANGAGGETKAQMERTLGLPVDGLNAWLCALYDKLPDDDDCRIALADSVWMKNTDNLAVKPEFLQTVADNYAAQAFAAPFDDSTVRAINEWCSRHTDGMIDEIIRKIDPGTLMFLINATLFDAKWQSEYEEKDIQQKPFHNADGTDTPVNLLRSEERTYLSGKGFTGFVRPYKGRRYAFVGLLPTDKNADVMQKAASLSGSDWRTMWDNRRGRTVRVGIPEFKSDFSVDLTETLKELGMTDAFSAMNADFTPMASCENANMFLGMVAQKTHVEVDRHGTKAAAVTYGMMMCNACAPSRIEYVILDRPFVYAIVDTESGLPLFIGVVTELK